MKILLLLPFAWTLTSAAPAPSGDETTEPILQDKDDFIEGLVDDSDDLIIIRPGLVIPGFNLASEAGIKGFPFQFPGLSVPLLRVEDTGVPGLSVPSLKPAEDPGVPGSLLAFTGLDLRDVFGGGTSTGGDDCDTLCQFLALVEDQVKSHHETFEDIQDKENEVGGDVVESGEFDVNNSTYSQEVLSDGTVVHKNNTVVADSDGDGNGFIFSTSLIHNLPSQQDLAQREASSDSVQDVKTLLNRSERNAPSSRLRLLSGGVPPTLEDDIRVNYLLLEDEMQGGLRRLEPNTELITEDPPGSGRVIPLAWGAQNNFAQREQVGAGSGSQVYGFNSQGEMVQQQVASEHQQQNNIFQQQNNPFQQQVNPFQQQNSPFQQQVNPFQQQVNPFQQQVNPFQQQINPFEQQVSPYQQQNNAFGQQVISTTV